MREILFRGKHIHVHKENEHLDGTWVYGYLCDKRYINSPELEGEMLVDPETISQYTGLKDTSGKKIFEGDIVQCVTSGKIGIVKFGLYDAKHYGFYIEWVGNSAFRKDIYYWSKNRLVKIVGNIFDNPDLIEEVAE